MFDRDNQDSPPLRVKPRLYVFFQRLLVVTEGDDIRLDLPYHSVGSKRFISQGGFRDTRERLHAFEPLGFGMQRLLFFQQPHMGVPRNNGHALIRERCGFFEKRLVPRMQEVEGSEDHHDFWHTLFLRSQGREKNNLFQAVHIHEQGSQSVDADAKPGGRRHAVL